MNDVMTKLNSLYETVEMKNKELDKLLQTSREIKEKQEKIQSDLDNRELSLNQRELKIGAIENVVEFKKNAERLLNEAKEVTEKTLAERKDFEEYLRKERADIAQCRNGVTSSIDALKEREKALEEEKKKIALDKLTYREHIIREIGKMTNAPNT
jgi:chromosome segregation ATPase